MVSWATSSYSTVSNLNLKSGPYYTDGHTTQFNISFQYLEDLDIVVELLNLSTGDTIQLIQNSDYTVTDGTPPADDGTLPGGTVTILPNAQGIANGSGQIPAGYTLTVTRDVALNQEQSYPESGVFPSAATEQALDRLTIISQQQQNTLNNTIQFPSTDNGTTTVLPSAATRASKYLSFTTSGDVTVSAGTIGGVTTFAATSPLSVTSSTGAVTVFLGTVGVANGGTGQTSLTANNLLTGNGTSAISSIAPGAVGSCLVSNGSLWSASSCSGTSNMTLGTTTTANPAISGAPNSGLYATSTTNIGIEFNGTKTLDMGTVTSAVDYVTITSGKSGTVPVIAVNGSTANQGINLTATGTGQVQIKGIAYPNSVTNNYALSASGTTAIVATPVSTLLDNGLGSTVGSLLSRTTTSWTPLADSTSGYVLTAQGAGVLPVYAPLPAASSGMTLLATVNASGSASATFSSTFITSTYNKYVIEFDSVYVNSLDDLLLQYSTNNGASWISTGYNSTTIHNGIVGGASSSGGALSGGTFFGSAAKFGAQGHIAFSAPSNSALYQSADWRVSVPTDASATLIDGTMNYPVAGTINAIRIVCSNGAHTITGNFHLYGLQGN